MNSNGEFKFLEIIRNGKFFFPAWKHYGNIPTDIRCDRCFRTNLTCSLGHLEYDLCMDCTEIVCNKTTSSHTITPDPIHTQQLNKMEKNIYNPLYTTRMAQDMFKYTYITHMEQDIFRQSQLPPQPYNPNQYATLMAQDIFKKNIR